MTKLDLTQVCKAGLTFNIHHINNIRIKITISYQKMQKKHMTKFNSHS